MFWRRPQPAPELPLSRDDVLAIFMALSDIKRWTLDILAILEEEEDDES
ncbi:MAG: hypothetical protein ACRDON_13200 [Gaiellaceae bacterium]